MTGNLTKRHPPSFTFGPFVLVPKRQLLLRAGAPVRIGTRALDLLTALVERAGEVLTKRELMARAWPDTVVDESNLKVNMASLRRALGELPGTPKYIATVVGRGYRFVVPVEPFVAMGSLGVAAATSRNNLPGTTRIFGRDVDLDVIEHDLEDSRLVSLVGAGGTGKTTLAIAVAERLLGALSDGVWFVDLSPLQDPSLVPHAISTVVGLKAHSSNQLTALCGYLQQRELLLLLDNCEHLIESVAAVVDQLLAEASGLKILATSREPLLLRGERVRRLLGLEAPPASPSISAEEALAYPAIQLFVERASQRLETFQLSDADAPFAAEICRRLDGSALAIELAATRVDGFGVGGLLEQLDHRFRLLTGLRGKPERHRTLAATLDWSYGLLAPREAALLRAVSVFASVFDVDAAATVSDLDRFDTQDALAQLAAKSLLSVDLAAEPLSYRLLETTRLYALDRLRGNGDEPIVRQRHAEYVYTVLERGAREWVERPARDWGTTYARVLDDLRSALAHADRGDATRSLLVRLAAAATLLWNHLSLTAESHDYLARAVDGLAPAGLSGSVTEMKLQLALAGAMMFSRGLIPEARVALQRSLDVAERIHDTDHRLGCLRMIGSYEIFTGNYQAGIRALEDFAALAAAEDPSALPDGETHLGMAEIFVGRLHSARRRLERLHADALRDANDPRLARFQYDRNVDVGNVLSYATWLTGSPDTAASIARATVEQAFSTKHELSLSNALAVAACPVLFLNGEYEEAHRHVEMLDEQVTRHGIVTWGPMVRFYRGALACAQQHAPNYGIRELEQAICEFRAVNHRARMPYFMAVLAEALAKSGRLDESLSTVQAALDIAHERGERWCLPEVLRVRAAILLRAGRSEDAEPTLVEAIAQAKEIGALSWQLRATIDLAKQWRISSREHDARALLQPVFDEFSEGFETRDLETAAELLTSLPRR